MYIIPMKGNRVGLKIVVQPNARKTKILGLYDNMVKVAIAAPPVDGKANKQVAVFFSEIFGIKKSEVEIVSGAHSRKKICVLGDLTESDLRSKLLPYLQ